MMPRKVVVTGISSGIGLATARRLLDCGHSVFGLARRPCPLEHKNLQLLEVDLSSETAYGKLENLVAQNPAIDALISNAGSGQFAALENFSAPQIRDSIQQNLLSHMLVVRALLPAMKRHSRSDVIFIGSEAALAGSRQGSLYCAAKFGLRGFSQALRAECSSRNVHIGIINPGMVRSEFFDRQHFEPGSAPENALGVDDVVDAIELMLKANDNAVIDEINLSPLQRVVCKK